MFSILLMPNVNLRQITISIDISNHLADIKNQYLTLHVPKKIKSQKQLCNFLMHLPNVAENMAKNDQLCYVLDGM